MKRLLSLLLCGLLLAGCTPTEAIGTEDPQREGFITSSDYTDRSQPPKLHVLWGDGSEEALPGSCSWNWRLDSDQWQGVCKDSLHPLECRSLLNVIELPAEEVMLVFGDMPDVLTVRRWSDAHWGDIYDSGEHVEVNEQSILLTPGGWVYEVVASWEDNGQYHGSAHYCFYVNVS